MMIKKPSSDNKTYDYIRLDNDLDVIIVTTDKPGMSAACLTVDVGYYDDPIPGLAHFLEHMLFMGSTTYPKENYFQIFINKNSGSTNAFTSSQHTCYYFDVLDEHFHDALHIFSRFFVDPLLSENAIVREMNAVNSEHEKNILLDNWRVRSVLREVSDSASPFHKFGTGALTTLNIPNIHKILTNFYTTKYSSNIMKLTIQTSTQIKKQLIAMFSQIKNKHIVTNRFIPYPFTNITTVHVIPIQDDQKLRIFYCIPSSVKHYKIKPLHYIFYILNNDDTNGLKQNLIKLGFCTDYNIFITDNDDKYEYVSCDFTLTPKGFKNIPTIIANFNTYLQQITPNKHMYDDLMLTTKISYDHQIEGDPIDNVVDICTNMHMYPIKHILSHELLDPYDSTTKSIIEEYVKHFKSPIYVISSKTNKATGTEQYYGAKYSVNVPIKRSSSTRLELSLPSLNKYIPKSITVLPKTPDTEYPIIISQTPEIWYKKDNTFSTPKVILSVILHSNKIFDTPKNYILFNIFIRVLENELAPMMFHINQTTSSISFLKSSDTKIFSMTFDCFPENIKPIITDFIKILRTLPITKTTVKNVITALTEDLINYKYEPPYIIIKKIMREKIYHTDYSYKILLSELKKLDISDIHSFNKHFFSMFTDMNFYIHGNIDIDTSKQICGMFNIFKLTNESIKRIITPTAEMIVYDEQPYNKEEANSAIYMFYEVNYGDMLKNKQWAHIQALLYLVNILASNRFFNKLRTVQQLGYVVRSFVDTYDDNDKMLSGYSFLIQSDKYDPDVLYERITEFINKTEKYIDKLKHIDEYKQSIHSFLDVNDNNIYDNFTRYYNQISKRQYVFDKNKQVQHALKSIAKTDIVNFFNKHFVNERANVRTLKVYGIAKKIE